MVRRLAGGAWEQKLVQFLLGLADPDGEGLAGLFGDFELHRSMGFLLHEHGAGQQVAALGDVANPQLHEVAGAQLAVDGQIEQGQLAGIVGHLQANLDRTDFLEFEGRLLANKLAFVPGRVGRCGEWRS
jgi:hypothetical protein